MATTNSSIKDLWIQEEMAYLDATGAGSAGALYRSSADYMTSKKLQDELAFYFSLGTGNKWVMWIMILLFIYLIYKWGMWVYNTERGRKVTWRLIWSLLLICFVVVVHCLLVAYF